MSQARVLVVDDEVDMLENCRRLLGAEGYECHTLAEPLRFEERLREVRPHVLLLDLRMPGVDGMTLLPSALAEDPHLPVVVITAFASLESAVHAMREGAFDYLAKPFSADQLHLAVERACRYRGLREENQALREQVESSGDDAIVGSSPPFLRILEQAKKVAATDANVLLCGESGTGKEVVARFIHRHSPRAARPFVPVDCAALPETLLESELFGHEKGAFTGAVSRRDGLLTEANRGTAFLDEITELTPALQAKLLRTLEDRKVRRLGGSGLTQLDVRLISASNANLEEAVAQGEFRQDLFYRLNVVPLHLPPLRERQGDTALLLQAFLARFADEMGREPPRLSPAAWDALELYPWPGNVRELKNLAQRLVALDDDGEVRLADLPAVIRGEPLPGRDDVADTPLPPYEEAREEALLRFKRSYLERLLAAHQGNVSAAARAAGMSRRNLHRWLNETGLRSPRKEEG